MRPSDFPRDRKFRDPTTPPYLEERKGHLVAHVFSYADAKRVQRNANGAFSHDAKRWLPPEERHHIRWHFMWAADPGADGRHTVLRGLVEDWFRQRAMAAMTRRVREHARSLRRSIVMKGTGEFDLATEFAYRLALQTICSLIGFPLHREKWLRHEMQIVARTSDPGRLGIRDNLESFLRDTVAERLISPQDELLDRIIDGWKAGTISERELLGYCFGMTAAGTETTGTSIVDAFALASEFDALDYCRAHLDDDQAMHLAIEETLRFGTPFPTTPTIFTTRPVTFDDIEVPAGSQVHVHLAAANRDRAINGSNPVARDPNLFDVTRSPNRHMAFGFGIHHCLGDRLTRLEMLIALRELLRYLPDLRFDQTRPFCRYAGIVDGITSAHFTFDQERAARLL